MVFSISSNQYWQGLDKVSLLAKKLPDFDFNVVGIERVDQYVYCSKNLIFHGFISDQEVYSKLIQYNDVGIGPLAWHRKHLNEGSPLKVREYLANCLPIIIAHFDSEVPKDFPYVLQLPNCENNIIPFLDSIYKFVIAMRGVNIPLELVSSIVNVEDKEKKRLTFFYQIINHST